MSKRIHVKPGKAQSVMGFFVGLLFCGLGIFMVIPTFGPFGIIWTLMAVAITVYNGINAFSQKGVASHSIEIEEDIAPTQGRSYAQSWDSSSTTSSTTEKKEESIEGRLTALNDLYKKELITADEYEEKRKAILEDL